MAKEHEVSPVITGTVQSIVMAVFAYGLYNRTEIGSMVPAEQRSAFSDFFEATQQNEVLEPRTTIMIQIAAALVNGCPTLIRNLLDVARQKKITDAEIGTILSIVMAVCAGGVRGRIRDAVRAK